MAETAAAIVERLRIEKRAHYDEAFKNELPKLVVKLSDEKERFIKMIQMALDSLKSSKNSVINGSIGPTQYWCLVSENGSKPLVTCTLAACQADHAFPGYCINVYPKFPLSSTVGPSAVITDKVFNQEECLNETIAEILFFGD